MTREEAIKKIEYDFKDAGNLILVLEKLNLIKFEEKSKEKYIFFPYDGGKLNVGVLEKDVFNKLYQMGFQMFRYK